MVLNQETNERQRSQPLRQPEEKHPSNVISTLIAAVTMAPVPLAILFVGNSHTAFNDVPNMVRSIFESDGTGRRVSVEAKIGGVLNDQVKDPATVKLVKDPKWDVVVLQGAMMSQSHRFAYSQEGGIALAKAAKKVGSRVILYAEWPRKGWDETEWIIAHYRSIAKDSGTGEIAPVGRAWDAVLKKRPKLGLWNPDGNHAEAPGSFVAATTIYFRLTKGVGKPTWRPQSVDGATALLIREAARRAIVPATK